MTTTHQPMLDKIAALLRKAESTTSPEEAALFTAKAEELMVKYSIEATQLDQDLGVEANIEAFSFHLNKTEMYAKAFINYLFSGVAEALGTVRVFRHSDNSKSYTLVGTHRDVVVAEQLMESLMNQCLSQMVQWAKHDNALKTLPRNEQKIARRQFILSFSSVVIDRLRATHRDVVRETTGAELVLVKQVQRVDRYVEEKMNVGQSRRSSIRGSHLGRAEGAEAGRRANIGSGGVGSAAGNRELS